MSNGNILSAASSWRVSPFIPVSSGDVYTLISNSFANGPHYCLYNSSKVLINCVNYNSLTSPVSILLNENGFIRFSGANYGSTNFYGSYCQNGNQAINDSMQDINNTINDDSVQPGLGQDYFTNFSDDNPLSNIVLFPVHLLEAASSSCSPVNLSLYNTTISIPCGDTIFWNRPYARDFRNWWNLFVGGLAFYYLGLKLFRTINNAVDPLKDDFEHLGGL